jgi:hypothetical protein
MSIRIRKLIGAVLLLLLVTVWSLLAMAVAQFAFSSPNEIAAWIFYVVAGLGWVLPAMPLIKWMEGGKRNETPPSARPRQRVRAKRGPMTGSGGDPASKTGFPLSRE